MWKIVRNRLLRGVLTLFFVSVLVFIATMALPGDVVGVILGRDATPELVSQLREKLGLTGSLPSQYFRWLSNTVRLDLGDSLTSGVSASSLIMPAVGNSLFLMLCTALIVTPLALMAGIWSAVRRDRPTEHLLGVVTLALAGMPEFVIGILLAVTFATSTLHLFPAVFIRNPGDAIWANPAQLVLPIATLVLSILPYMIRTMRANMIEVLDEEYVQQARLKGLRERIVLWKHALPNALGPFLQVSALQFAYVLGGAVVVEYLFRFPGIGLLLVTAIYERDLPVIQGITLLIAAFQIVINLLADVLNVLVTPRVRTQS